MRDFAPARAATRRQLLVWGLGAVAAVTGAALAGRHFSASTREAPRGAAIAVLPFDNLSAAPEDGYIADGLSEQLVATLRRMPGVQVAPRTSAVALKRQRADPRDIGRRLGVGYILDAGVRAAGDTLRVTARLVSATNGFPVWADAYQGGRRDVFSVQQRIVDAIVQSLHLRQGDVVSALPGGPPDPVTYDLYLRGRYSRDQRDRAGLTRAADDLSAAVAHDSLFAAAWAGLGDVYSRLGILGLAPPGDVFPRARAALSRAVALDPGLAEGHALLGIVRLFFDWDWVGARHELDRAIALDSNDIPAHLFRAWYFVAVDSVAQGVAELEATERRDPLSPIVGTRLASLLFLLGRSDEAFAQVGRMIDLDSTYLPARLTLALDLAWSDRCDDAVEAARRLPVAQDSDKVLATQAIVLASCGRTAEASQPVRWLETERARRYLSPFLIAQIYAAQGDAPRTFAWLDTAFVERTGYLPQVKQDPSFRRYRHDPRFQRLLRKVGLTPDALGPPATP
jgi:TolB-like protein/tetratricopeptide (TPR) repeat protein